MTTAKAKVFMSGRSQAVRLPKEFRLPGREVRIRRVGNGILLEPIETDVQKWLDELHALFADGEWPDRDQPEMPPCRVNFDD